MTPLEIALLLCVVFIGVVAVFAMDASYRNGATDGYGYSREPKNPGYQRAGEFLRKYMAHRWPELVAKFLPRGRSSSYTGPTAEKAIPPKQWPDDHGH